MKLFAKMRHSLLHYLHLYRQLIASFCKINEPLSFVNESVYIRQTQTLWSNKIWEKTIIKNFCVLFSSFCKVSLQSMDCKSFLYLYFYNRGLCKKHWYYFLLVIDRMAPPLCPSEKLHALLCSLLRIGLLVWG